MKDESTPEIIPGARPFYLAGNRTGILLIHGYGGSIGDYRELGERLHQRGYSVSGMRIAGHGQGNLALKKSRVNDWRDSVKQAADRLLAQCRTIIVIGGSLGGDLAIDYVHAHPDRALALITINAPIRYKPLGRWQIPLLRACGWLMPSLPKFKQTADERQLDLELGSSSAWPVSGLLDSYAFINRQVKPALPEIKIPSLVISSAHDAWVDTDSAEYIIGNLGAKQKERVTIPSQRHNILRDEANQGLLFDHILAFINRVDKPWGNVL